MFVYPPLYLFRVRPLVPLSDLREAVGHIRAQRDRGVFFHHTGAPRELDISSSQMYHRWYSCEFAGQERFGHASPTAVDADSSKCPGAQIRTSGQPRHTTRPDCPSTGRRRSAPRCACPARPAEAVIASGGSPTGPIPRGSKKTGKAQPVQRIRAGRNCALGGAARLFGGSSCRAVRAGRRPARSRRSAREPAQRRVARVGGATVVPVDVLPE